MGFIVKIKFFVLGFMRPIVCVLNHNQWQCSLDAIGAGTQARALNGFKGFYTLPSGYYGSYIGLYKVI